MEYLVEVRRNQFTTSGIDDKSIDTLVKQDDSNVVMIFLLKEKKAWDSIELKNPDCKPHLELFRVRAPAYWRQLSHMSIPAMWENYNGKVLSLWGGFDILSNESDHKLLVDMINKQHPGSAKYIKVDNCSHNLRLVNNYDESSKNLGPFNKNVSDVIVKWINESQ